MPSETAPMTRTPSKMGLDESQSSAMTSQTASHDSYLSDAVSQLPLHHNNAVASLPRVDRKQIEVGALIGAGGFCRVYEIHSGFSFQPRFVIKTLQADDEAAKKNNKNYAKRFAKQVSDLKKEGQILASLNHRSDIVSICGWTFDNDGCGGIHHPDTTSSHFLVLERLDETLSDLLWQWRRKSPRYLQRNKPMMVAKRISILLDFAEALSYIHRCRILHRDLKPSNIGFQEGVLKLFDFGLARVLPEEKGDFQLTDMVGTLRYMSPECGRREEYGLPADVYAFGLICYEVLSLKEPYSTGESMPLDKAAVRRIWYGRERPSVEAWPEAITSMLERCWDDDATVRPTMEEAKVLLANCLPAQQQQQGSSKSFSSKTKSWRNKMKRLARLS